MSTPRALLPALFALERADNARVADRPSLAQLFGSTHVFAPDNATGGLAACVGKLQDEVTGVYAAGGIDLGDRLGHCGAIAGSTALLHKDTTIN